MRKRFNKSTQHNKKYIQKRFGKGAKLVEFKKISPNRFTARIVKTKKRKK